MGNMSFTAAGAIHALSKIARSFNQDGNAPARIEGAFKQIGETLDAQGVGLIRRHRKEDHPPSIWDRIGYWRAGKGISRSGPAGHPNSILFGDLNPAWRHSLEKQTTLFINDAHIPSAMGAANLVLAPIFPDERLFGCLALWDLPNEETFVQGRDFLSAAIDTLTLFITRRDFEKRLDDVIEFMPDPTFVLDTRGHVRHWNSAEEKLTGWKAERLLGKGNFTHAIPFYNQRRPTVANLILTPDPGWEKRYTEFQRHDDTIFATAFCPSLPGGGALITSKTHRLFDLNGHPWGAIHAVRDITSERQMEEKLQRSESMYRTITDFSGVGITLFRKNKVLYCNKRFRAMIGIANRSITFGDILQWVFSEDRREINAGFEALFNGSGEPIRLEIRSRRDDGLRHYNTYAQKVLYDDKPTIHFVADDVTESKEIERKARLHELRLYHEDRLTSLGTMAAGIAHELNQPLNTIRILTDGLLYGRDLQWELDPQALYKDLEMVSRQVVRMSRVIQNVRGFAREDRRCADTEVDINTAVQNVFDMIGSQCKAHGIVVHKDLREKLPPVRAGLSRLEQVVMNLVVNARQALDQCHRKNKELWIETGTAGGWIFIEVADNALGISPKLSLKIFDPFFTTKEAGEGTGLGLSISQSIVADFKGQIEAFNNKKGGATFVVTIPCAT